MTDEERWAELVADWQPKHDAVIAFPLFKGRMMQNDRVAEYESLREAERAARKRMDDFIAAYRQRI